MSEIKDYERLPDPSDDATLREEQFLAVALDKASKAKPVPATGFCLYCKAKLKKGLRFCDKDCARDWENEQRMKKIAGGV